MLTPAVRDAAMRWITEDPEQTTADELKAVLARAMAGDDDATHELGQRMNGSLTFGTAGLRGPVRAGTNGMNVAVVLRTTAGLAAYLQANGHAGGTVIVGRDARHGSEAFFRAAAEVLAGAGFDVRVVPDPASTPVTAYLVRALGAVAGVQITASHNPPQDNGYKVYLDQGAQIIPPADRAIEAAIEQAGPARMVTRSTAYTEISQPELDGYVDRLVALPRGAARELRVVSTALHGVGAATFAAAFQRAGFTEHHQVAEQAEPDPDFPTVVFPNPEEPGAANRLLALAAEVDADLAVAFDPDGDRCALGVRDRDGSWRMLRGDEAGVLLGSYVLSTVDAPDPLVATSIVSSSMLGRIAEAHGARYTETLTGFKWLARAGDGLVFAYEEALGLCVDPDAVRDKDGASAAILACDLAATLKASGRSLLDALDDLSERHGVHLTDAVNVRYYDPKGAQLAMSDLRKRMPDHIGDLPVVVEDLLPRDNTLRFTGDGLRVLVRPSGTEPKLKIYLEVVQPVTDDLGSARLHADLRLTELRTAVDSLLAG
ncbi:phospho-sugar mutase [Pseudonocardiaceae bacterium YIM PH 21723]|nr:phospho-sugar mutase [Pseudonocardiaceae bacterium YIM PH 21723]